MAYGDLWMQLRGPFPSSYAPTFDALAPSTGMRPVAPRAFGLDAGTSGGLPDAQVAALVSTFLQGQLAPQGLVGLDPATRAQLEREIKDRFQALSQSGLPLEARPGSKAA
ncbi:hypothetical protein L6R52_24745, partial [Myxococcota bacterium]|nr:hypothetical protein [Myxococcota bacterium]